MAGTSQPRQLHSAGRAPAVVRCLVLAMAKPTKAAEFRGLSAEQIDQEVATAKRALFDLRLKQKTRQELKTSDFGFYQRKVAQLLTIKREQQLAEGISKRESRRMEKQQKIADGFKQF